MAKSDRRPPPPLPPDGGATRRALVIELLDAAFPTARSTPRVPWPLQLEERVEGDERPVGPGWVRAADDRAWVRAHRPDPDDQRLARVGPDAAERLAPLAREAVAHALTLWRPAEAERMAVVADAGHRAAREAILRLQDSHAATVVAAPSFACLPARSAVALALSHVGDSPALAPRALLALAALVALEDVEAMFDAEWSPTARSPVRRDNARRVIAERLRCTLEEVLPHRAAVVVALARAVLDEQWIIDGADLGRVRQAELEVVTRLRAARDELGEIGSTLFVLPAPRVELLLIDEDNNTTTPTLELPPAEHAAALALAVGAPAERNAASHLRIRLRREHHVELEDLLVIDAR